MITNEINVGNAFKMRVNFNLIKKAGENDKRQIWLTTTINNVRARVYTGLRIEQKYWDKPPRGRQGGKAIEGSNMPQPVREENTRINSELRRILGFCRDYADAVCASDLMST